MKKITWGCCQPLTGGMYLGTEEAIGHPAEWIISFPGLDIDIYNNKKQLVCMGNEKHMLEYLKKKNTLPPYWHFEKNIFDYNPEIDEEITFVDSKYSIKCNKEKLLSKPVDIIVAVPVCAGLSGANTAEHGKQDSAKNNNMKFLAKYVLKTLKPKAYIFENAPALYTFVGTQTREFLNALAEEAGYSVTYVRTNTNLHDNPQFRQRTFVIFWQWPNGKKCPPPEINAHNHPMKNVIEFLARIPENATQNDPKTDQMNEPLKNFWDYKFIKHKFGKKWRESIGGKNSLVPYIINHNLEKEAIEFCNDEKVTKHLQHCRDKRNQSKGWYDSSISIYGNEYVPTIYFRSAHRILHPSEDRFYTMREIMSFMKMPYDFEYLHTWRSMGSIIGQNVPAGTIKDWILEVKKIIEDPEKRLHFPKTKKDEITGNEYFFNNCNPVASYYPNKRKQGFNF